jgi:hypothetical protein
MGMGILLGKNRRGMLRVVVSVFLAPVVEMAR